MPISASQPHGRDSLCLRCSPTRNELTSKALMLFSLYDVQVVVSGLDHAECVNFGPDGRGYAGGEDGQLVRFTMDGKSEQVATVAGGGIGGLCLDGNGNVYECDYRLPHVYKITAQGKVTLHSKGTE